MRYHCEHEELIRLLRQTVLEFGRDGHADFGTLRVYARLVAERQRWVLPPEPEFAWVLEEVLASTDLFVVDWRLDFRQIDHSPCWLVGAPDAKRERTL